MANALINVVILDFPERRISLRMRVLEVVPGEKEPNAGSGNFLLVYHSRAASRSVENGRIDTLLLKKKTKYFAKIYKKWFFPLIFIKSIRDLARKVFVEKKTIFSSQHFFKIYIFTLGLE